MADETEVLTVSEMRRRRRALEALDGQVKDLVDARVVATQASVQELTAQLRDAERAAGDALALAVRVYGASDVVASLTMLTSAEVDKAVKGRTAAVVGDLLNGLREEATSRLKAAAEKRAARRRPAAVTDDAEGVTAGIPVQSPAVTVASV